MRQLTSLDAQFLALENSRQTGHVGSLAMLDASTAPGNDAQLADQVARIMSRPLDRARPLWELYVIEGHESGLVCVLTKIHHAVIDGLSGAEIMALLLDLTPEGREVPPPADEDLADRTPTSLHMLGLGL